MFKKFRGTIENYVSRTNEALDNLSIGTATKEDLAHIAHAAKHGKGLLERFGRSNSPMYGLQQKALSEAQEAIAANSGDYCSCGRVLFRGLCDACDVE